MKHPDAKTEIRVPEEYRPLLEDLRLLTKDGENPNRMTKRAREGLWKSMVKYGWIYPILVDKKGMLGDGEQRLETCLTNKEHYGPVLRLDVDDIDRRLLRQITNKLRGVHDPDLDQAEYRRLIEGGRRKELISILQINEKAIKDALEGKIKEETYRIPPLEEVITDIELGDIYQVGPHRILCGDSTKEDSFTKILDGRRAHMVMTDPPYNVDYASKNEFLNKYDKGNRIQTAIINDAILDYTAFLHDWLEAMKNQLTDYNTIYITIAGKTIKELLIALDLNNYYLSQVLVWNKNNTVIGRMDYMGKHELIVYCWKGKHKFYGKNERTVWDIPKPHQSKLHPTMKPVELCSRAIGNSSLPDEIVLDPFAGSGSTLIACEQLDRQGYMIEIDPRYCQIIIDRFKAYTGQEAIKK